jgi:hypothetical protein
MAERSHGYGHYSGHYPMPGSGPSNPQSPLYYPPSQAGAIPPANHTASRSAYDHNSTRIPGLGLGGHLPMVTTAPFSPGALQPRPAQAHGQPTHASFQSHQQPPTSFPQQPPVTHQQSHGASGLEEGELSEGEFEDLYEPKALTNPPPAPSQNKSTRRSNGLHSRNTSVGDADGSSIYDPQDSHTIHASAVQVASNSLSAAENEYAPDDEWEPSYPERERSGSYSPYLSPREVHRKISVAKAASRDINSTFSHYPDRHFQSKYF